MPTFTVPVRRTEIYVAEAKVEANSQEEAKKRTQELLGTEGWDGVFNEGDDGEYCDSWSEIITCEACTTGTMAGPIPGTLSNGERCDTCDIYDSDHAAVIAAIAKATPLTPTP